MKTYSSKSLRQEIGNGGAALGFCLGLAKGQGRYFIPLEDQSGHWEWREVSRVKYYVYAYKHKLFEYIPGDVLFALDRRVLKYI